MAEHFQRMLPDLPPVNVKFLTEDGCVDHVLTTCKEQMDAEGSSDFRHSSTTVRTEATGHEAQL